MSQWGWWTRTFLVHCTWPCCGVIRCSDESVCSSSATDQGCCSWEYLQSRCWPGIKSICLGRRKCASLCRIMPEISHRAEQSWVTFQQTLPSTSRCRTAVPERAVCSTLDWHTDLSRLPGSFLEQPLQGFLKSLCSLKPYLAYQQW